MSDKRRVYMDCSATTPVRAEVLEAMLPYMSEKFGNASSFHSFGREANAAVEAAREKIADALNAHGGRIYLTSGGTEGDNWVIKGMLRSRHAKGRHIVTSAIEHHGILHPCATLEKEGYEVTYVQPDEYGMISPQDVKAAIRPDTALVSIMYVNNEVGTIEPIREIAKVAHEAGVPMHTDAVQAVGSIKVDIEELGVDMLSLSAHKFYGPKGVGALYVKKGIIPADFMEGGAQEYGHRAGTYNTPGVVGMGEAIKLATQNIEGHIQSLTELRDLLQKGFEDNIEDVHLNGHPTLRHPGNVNMSFGGIEGEGMLLMLDLEGIAASSGSACTSGSLEASHVLTAMKTPQRYSHSTVRFTLGNMTTREDVEYVIEKTAEAVKKLRKLSPFF